MNKKIFITIGILGILIFLSIFLFSLKSQGKVIPFETVSKGKSFGHLNKETINPIYTVLTNKNELESFLNKFGIKSKGIGTFSEDDFKEYILICAYFGAVPTVELKVLDKFTIKKITAKDKFVEILVQLGKYNPIGPEVVSAPYHIVKVKRDYFKEGKYLFVFKDTDGKELNRVEVEIKKTFGKESKNLSQIKNVKVAVWYQTITDYKAFNRTIDDVITHLKETRTDFVFRAFWRWKIIPDIPCPNDPVCSLPTISKRPGVSYQELSDAIKKIKSELPDVIICGGVPFERLNPIERNPITGEILDREKTWAMALDPSKWGINMSKEEFQENRAKVLGYWHPSYPGEPYNWKTATAYYPDITNPEFQELLLSWAKKQIDCGVDAIWVDLLFAQPAIFAKITKDKNHPAVKESFKAASKIIDEIHAYGYSKYGKYIYVGTWPAFLHFGTPDVDFVTAAPVADEVRYGLFENKWNKLANMSKEKRIPVFAFMDEVVGSIKTSQCGMAPFTQEFSIEERREKLKELDKYFLNKGIVFIYPLHGGWIGYDAKVLSFGKFKIYDALAPEFQTYETIKDLAQNKKR